MNVRLILWDWNGTLLNDVDACVDAMNQMLAKRSMDFLSIEKYQNIFTFPVQNYYKALGFDFNKDSFEELSIEYIQLYKDLSLKSPLQEGATELLEYFKEKNYKQVIISASEQKALEKQVEERNITKYFDSIIGLDNIHAHSKLHNALAYINELKIKPQNICFIGDTYHDYEVAAAIGCNCILVKSGHMDLVKYTMDNVAIVENLKSLYHESRRIVESNC
jgi:phosphoglycolate phosphatase